MSVSHFTVLGSCGHVISTCKCMTPGKRMIHKEFPCAKCIKERREQKEIDLNSTTDAQVWAKEFLRLFGHRRDEIDEGLMIGWFANAMMAQEMMDNHRKYEENRVPDC